jgi:hypothetical protein
MPLPLSAKSNALPKCFPVGAKYVVEGRGGEDGDLQVVSRYVVLPTGRRINVPAELSQKQPVRVTSSRRQPRGRAVRSQAKTAPMQGQKKIFGRRGTAR